MLRRLPPNALGALYMTLAALAYVVNDGLIRLATERGLDVYQALFLRGCGMVVVFAAAAGLRGEGILPVPVSRPVAARVGAEVVATALFFAGLVHLRFANAQTILMLVPFAVIAVAGSLGERVDARHWLAVLAGFVGVLAVIRPTPSGFSLWTLPVLASAFFILVRELATRRVEPSIGPVPVALLTAVAITAMAGSVSVFTGWGPIRPANLALIALAGLCLSAGYLLSIQTVRVGDLSVSAPFRYTSVLGAVLVGLLLFDETPDALTALGCTLIVVAGLITAVADQATRPPPTGPRRRVPPLLED